MTSGKLRSCLIFLSPYILGFGGKSTGVQIKNAMKTFSAQDVASVPQWLSSLAWLMRKMPKQWRKLDYWWMLLYRRLGGGGFSDDPNVDAKWPRGPQAPVRIRHGVLMCLDLSDWSERRTFFQGHYYQFELLDLLEELIRPGDYVIDVGANIGMVTALSARLVGPSGSVHAFEPSKDTYARLRKHIEINAFNNVTLHSFALSDHAGEAKLLLPTVHSGQARVSVDQSDGLHRNAVDVRLARGDEVLSELNPLKPMLIKIDVEGHEFQTLNGLSNLLGRSDVAAICEIVTELLAHTGSTPSDIFNLMSGQDFIPFKIAQKRTRWVKRMRLDLLAETIPKEDCDVLFIKRDSCFWKRLGMSGT
jgi:FkbM family methyltransferase